MSKLPIIQPKSISYSTLKEWQLCPHFYLLKNIKRLVSWQNSVDSIYGNWVHDGVQDVLGGTMTVPEAQKRFSRRWKIFWTIYSKHIDADKYNRGDMLVAALEMIQNILPAMQKEFGNDFEVLSIEERLQLPSGTRFPQQFKGFIDIVLKLGDGTIVIVDFKTCKSNFMFRKYQDKYKDYQLILYKHFWSIKHESDILKDSNKSIQTYFITLERNPKSKNRINFIQITSGPKKVENALKWLETGLSAINRNLWLKKRTSCHAYGKDCAFYKTEHCN